MTLEALPVITWTRFFLVTALVLLVYIVYILFLKKRLKYFFGKNTDLAKQHTVTIEKVLIIIMTIVIFSFFILIKPLFHSFLLLLILFIGYKPISNVILGMVLTQEVGLRIGNLYTIGDIRGVLNKLGWTGMHISKLGQNTFIPYKKAYEIGISHKASNVPSMLRLKCVPIEEMGIDEATTYLKNKIFGFPFLIDETMPTIKPENNYLVVDLGINNDKHLKSLKSAIENCGFNVELLES